MYKITSPPILWDENLRLRVATYFNIGRNKHVIIVLHHAYSHGLTCMHIYTLTSNTL